MFYSLLVFAPPKWMDNVQNSTSYHLEMVRLCIDAAIDALETNDDKELASKETIETLKSTVQLVDKLEETLKKLKLRIKKIEVETSIQSSCKIFGKMIT